MNYPTIPYCGRRTSSKSECPGCIYYDIDDNYCNYWDIHSPDECPYCKGTGVDSLDGGQCEECNGTGIKQ